MAAERHQEGVKNGGAVEVPSHAIRSRLAGRSSVCSIGCGAVTWVPPKACFCDHECMCLSFKKKVQVFGALGKPNSRFPHDNPSAVLWIQELLDRYIFS